MLDRDCLLGKRCVITTQRPRESPALLKDSIAPLASLSQHCLSSVGSFQIHSEGIIRAASFLPCSNSQPCPALSAIKIPEGFLQSRDFMHLTYQVPGVFSSPSLSPVCANRKLSSLTWWNTLGLSLGRWPWGKPWFSNKARLSFHAGLLLA